MNLTKFVIIMYRIMGTGFRGQDAWRRHPLFQNLWKSPFPGFKPAVVVFSAYVAAEYAWKTLTIGPPKTKQIFK
jgi:hypothetical protein